jgi:hypothetical protein
MLGVFSISQKHHRRLIDSSRNQLVSKRRKRSADDNESNPKGRTWQSLASD